MIRRQINRTPLFLVWKFSVSSFLPRSLIRLDRFEANAMLFIYVNDISKAAIKEFRHFWR